MPKLSDKTIQARQTRMANLLKSNKGNQSEIARKEGVTPSAICQRVHNKNMGIQQRLQIELERIGFTVEDFLHIIADKVRSVDCKDHPKYCTLFSEIISDLKAPQKNEVKSEHTVTLTPDEETEFKRVRADIVGN